MNAPSGKLPSLGVALIPVATLLVSMALAILVFEQDPHIPLIFSTVVAALMAWTQGYRWADLEDGLVDGIRVGLKPILILMIIGVLIAVWISAGIVPYLIYLGLEILHPRGFLAAACVICAIVSLATGSSWTTAGTVGVALMGIGAGLEVPAAMIAGAVVSGAYFGDKMSPLSDTTNLAPGVTGVELFAHIRHMFYTTLPAFGIALAMYIFLGLFLTPGEIGDEAVGAIQASLDNHYNLTLFLLLPPLLVVVLSAMRIPALPVLLVSVGLGAVAAWLFQGTGPGDLIGFAHYGYEAATGHPDVDSLLSRGGLDSMMYAVSLIICALAFGGIMEKSGGIARLSQAVLHRVKGPGGLVTATAGTCVGVNVAVSDQYLSIVVPGRMFASAYRERGLHAKNLSRTLEDAGTITSPLIPWNTCGATMMAVLAVSSFAFLPYAFFNLLTPVIAILFAYRGIGQAPLEEARAPSTKEAIERRGAEL